MMANQECLAGSTIGTKQSFSTSSSESPSRLLFGEIDSCSNQSFTTCRSTCSLILCSSPAFIDLWSNERCRETLLSHLPPTDLSNLRLVCHDFGEKAASLLFNSITVNFKPSTFSRPAKMVALQRIGHHVRTFTFEFPRTLDTILPPLINPSTGETLDFTWNPRTPTPSKTSSPKYGDWETTNLLTKQYPPLFHAATDLPSFIHAFTSLPNLSVLQISCPEIRKLPPQTMDIVSHALLCLRISIERAGLTTLTHLHLNLRSTDILQLSPIQGGGRTPQSPKPWAKIQSLDMVLRNTGNVKQIQAYVQDFPLRSLRFRWGGQRGPVPLLLLLSLQKTEISSGVHPALRKQTSQGQGLTYLGLENVVLEAEFVRQVLAKYKGTLMELRLENVVLKGKWEDALGKDPEEISGARKRRVAVEEVGDLPIGFDVGAGSPVSSGGRSRGRSGVQGHSGQKGIGDIDVETQVRRLMMGEDAQKRVRKIQGLRKKHTEGNENEHGKIGRVERVKKACGDLMRWRV